MSQPNDAPRRVYDASTYFSAGLEPELQRLKAQVEISWQKEAGALRRLGVDRAASVLEMGSGPGFVTEKLLELVPEGSVTSVDVDAALIARALLKPGDFFVTMDFDIRLGMVEPPFSEYDQLREGAEVLLRLRGTDPRFGRRKQRRMLEDAGFVEIEVESIDVDNDEIGSLEPFIASTLSPDVVGAALVAIQIWSQSQLDAYRSALAALKASGDPLIVQSRPIAWGRKPR
jgi:SAM-dependent methyltransferase